MFELCSATYKAAALRAARASMCTRLRALTSPARSSGICAYVMAGG